MAGFRGAREGIMLVLLVLTVVDANTSSATTWTRGGSLTASTFVAPRRRHLQYAHFRERDKSIVCDTRGPLSPRALCPTRRHVPLLAIPKPSDEEMEERKKQLRTLLCASKKDIDKLVKKNPSLLLRRDIVEHYSPKLALLQKRLGISQKAAGKLCLGANRLLSISYETLEGKLDWLVSRLNTKKAQLRKIIELKPEILTLSIEENIRPSLENIQSRLEMSDDELTKAMVKQPDTLCCNFSTEKLATRLPFLQKVLCIEMNDIAGLRKAILRRPAILYWPEDRIIGVQNYLRYRVGLGDARIAKLMRNRPEFMTSNISTLEERANWIQSEFSLSDDELSDLLGKSQLLLSSEEKLKTMCQFFRLTFALDNHGLKDLVTKQPGLVSRTEKAIEEKVKFYSQLVGVSEAKRIVTESSNLLKISLEKRLKPRLSQVQNAGTEVVWTEQLIQRLARRPDDVWERYGLGEAPRGPRTSD